MPAYNAEKYVAEALQSILDQTFKEFELIIIDDCSSDKTSQIIHSFSDPRIILLKNSKKLGVAASLNLGIASAKGEYIARMDADDISLPRRLENQLEYMDKHPKIGISGAFAKIISTPQNRKTWKQPINDSEIKALMLFSCPLLHPTVIFRKKTLDEYNLRYNENYQSAQDYELWSRAIDYVTFGNLPKVVLRYRVHTDAVSHFRSTEQKENAGTIRAYLCQKMNIPILQVNISINEYEKWLLFIRDNSSITKYCDAGSLSNILGKIWFSKCVESSTGRINTLKRYWHSSLTQFTLSSVLKSVAIILKIR